MKVTGSGSTLTTTDDVFGITVGSGGTGTFTIESGADVTTARWIDVGSGEGSEGHSEGDRFGLDADHDG